MKAGPESSKSPWTCCRVGSSSYDLESDIEVLKCTLDEDDILVVKLAERMLTIITDMLADTKLIVIQTPETPQAQDPLREDDTLSKQLFPTWRSNEAVKLEIARELWNDASKIFPAEDMAVICQPFLTFLSKKEPELTREEEPSSTDAREQWTMLCVEVLLGCSPSWLQSFWGVDGNKTIFSWDWRPETRGFVWRKFCAHWQEVSSSKWENILLLLAVPFA